MIPTALAKYLLGPETTPGTAVTPSKQLLGLSFSLTPSEEIARFRPDGVRLDTATYLTAKGTEVDFEGILDANALAYVMASAVANVSPSQIMDGTTPTGAYQWSFTLNPTSSQTRLTYTIGLAGPSYAYRAAYGLLHSFSIEVSNEAKLSGSGVARALESISPPASVIQVPAIPLGPTFALTMDSTAGGIGTTAVQGALSVTLEISETAATVRTGGDLDFSTHVDAAPDATLSFTLAGDVADYLDLVRTGARRYVRLTVTGPTLYSGGVNVVAMFQADLPVVIEKVDKFSDEDGVYAAEITARVVYDASLSPTFEVINNLGAL
jgi:hypothetical protein